MMNDIDHPMKLRSYIETETHKQVITRVNPIKYQHFLSNFVKDHEIMQLMEGGVITETGQTVQLIVVEERKPEPGLVLTQLQLMVAQIVLGRRLKLIIVININAQVNNTAT